MSTACPLYQKETPDFHVELYCILGNENKYAAFKIIPWIHSSQIFKFNASFWQTRPCYTSQNWKNERVVQFEHWDPIGFWNCRFLQFFFCHNFLLMIYSSKFLRNGCRTFIPILGIKEWKRGKLVSESILAKFYNYNNNCLRKGKAETDVPSIQKQRNWF